MNYKLDHKKKNDESIPSTNKIQEKQSIVLVKKEEKINVNPIQEKQREKEEAELAEQEKQRIEFFKTHDEEPTYHSDDINELISNNYDTA